MIFTDCFALSAPTILKHLLLLYNDIYGLFRTSCFLNPKNIRISPYRATSSCFTDTINVSFFVQAQKTPASVSLYHYTLLFVFEQGERILNMKITLITVGKIKEKFYRDAIAEYSKRLSRYCKLNIV